MHLFFVFLYLIFSSPGASSSFGLSIGMEGIAGREFGFFFPGKLVFRPVCSFYRRGGFLFVLSLFLSRVLFV